jgi:hypothetical protein
MLIEPGALPRAMEEFSPRTARTIGSWFHGLELLFGNPELRIDARVLPDAEYALRDVVTDLWPELETFGISACGDPHVRHVRMVINDEVATRGDLVVAGMRLRDRRILEQWEAMCDESA